MSMSRHTLAAALLLGLVAAPTLAQSNPTPEESAAARTMQQNQRAYVAPPTRPQVAQEPVAKDRPVAAAVPPIARRRVVLADRTTH